MSIAPASQDAARIRSHPTADLFPLLDDVELAQLALDIHEHGLRDPIVLHPDGSILDGRNRYHACRRANVEPRYRTWDGQPGTELAYVISVNLHRRHLSESQRPQISRVADPYGVAVFSSSGLDSLTFKHELAGELAACAKRVEALHIGDYDESGESIFDVLAEDVPALGEDAAFRFCRLAVIPAQIAELGLPTAPPKPADRRGKGIVATTQAEAIPPDVLAQIVRAAILERLDGDGYQAERSTRRELARRLRGIEGKP